MRVRLPLAIDRDEAGRLLPAMLQGVQPETRKFYGVRVSADANNATHGSVDRI